MGHGRQQPQFHDQALAATRYREARDAARTPVPPDEYARDTGRTFADPSLGETQPHRLQESEEVWEVANSAVDAAVARGDFDHLAYAGRPIPGLGGTEDPDWWIKGLIEREHVTGLGPPALLLRKEDAGLDAALDATGSEAQVRELLADFNARIIDARRQLLGGPPVVTRLRDIDAEVAAWRGRAAARRDAFQQATAKQSAAKQAAAGESAAADTARSRGAARHRGFLARLLRRR